MNVHASRRDVLRRLAELIENRRADGVFIVGIDGIDAAGKTIFADELAEVMEARHVTVTRVSIDGFHNPAHVRHRRDEASPALSYYEDSFDYPAFRRAVLDPLAPGGDRMVVRQVFDHATDSPVEVAAVLIPDDSVLLVDGIFLGRPELIDAWNLWVFLAVRADVARTRGVARDAAALGPEAHNRYERRYGPGQDIYLRTVDPAATADIVIDNTSLRDPEIVRVRPVTTR